MKQKIKQLRDLLEIWFNKKTALEHYHLKKAIQDDIEKLLLDILPQDSSIDCDWKFIWYKNGNLNCCNSLRYYCNKSNCIINNNNCYIKYIPFKIKFFKYKSSIGSKIINFCPMFKKEYVVDYKNNWTNLINSFIFR